MKKCSRVYLESYTSLLLVPRERLVRASCCSLLCVTSLYFVWNSNFCVQEEYYGKNIIDADREMVEMVRGSAGQGSKMVQ